MKYKIVEPPLSELEKVSRTIENTVVKRLDELEMDDMSKAEGAPFPEWFACQQVLLQAAL